MIEGEKQVTWLGRNWSRLVMIVAAVAIGVAVWRGSHPATDQALPQGAQNDPLVALEARTREDPKDGEAWAELAARYFDAGRFADAVAAYSSAVGLAPRDAALRSARGEARVMASERDPMPVAAVSDFETALGLDPKDPRARYFLAVRRDLAGDHRGAIEAWLALLADTPPGAVWEADLRRTIEQVGKINKIDVAARLGAVKQPAAPVAPALAAIPGPSATDLSRAKSIPPSEQRAMAEGMVARLDARLRTEPGNVEGWIMLIRSRVTLDQPDKARAALDAAIKANPGDAGRLREQAALLGVR